MLERVKSQKFLGNLFLVLGGSSSSLPGHPDRGGGGPRHPLLRAAGLGPRLSTLPPEAPRYSAPREETLGASGMILE